MGKKPPSRDLPFSRADERVLARLVDKYGKKRVAQRAMTMRSTQRGRRPSIFPSQEIALLDWIEERAKEYPKSGTTKVLREIYEHLCDYEKSLPDFEDWRLQMKEALRRARRAVEDQAEIDDMSERHHARRRESK